MPRSDATLHMLCGKIAAGKSTLFAKLAQAERTLIISEDRWIAQLYGPELKTLADYFERCERLRATLAPHVVGLQRAGIFGRPGLPRQHGGLKALDACVI